MSIDWVAVNWSLGNYQDLLSPRLGVIMWFIRLQITSLAGASEVRTDICCALAALLAAVEA